MNNGQTETLAVDGQERPAAILVRLWNEVEQMVAEASPARTALVRLRPATALASRTEERKETSGRVRYSFD